MDVFGGAPRFLAYPRPVLVQSGTDAVLKCQIAGDPRPAVIWERNNEKVDPQGRYRVFEDGNVYNLILAAVTVEDSGQYICKAKNSIGETYAAATLRVEGEAQELELREENKPRFLIKPLSTRAGRGEDAVFSCKVWGNPQPDVVWEKDGKKLNDIFESTHFSVGSQDGGWFQLKIFKTRAPDGGVYTCKARNEFGEALAGAVLLVDAGPGHEDEANRNGYANGHWKPVPGRGGRPAPNRSSNDAVTKTAKVKMFAVTEGKHAKFRCFVTGKPKPEIIWRKDGRLILSGRRYLLYEDREGYFTLKVLYCKQKDNGVYVCAASNTAGQTLSAVHLCVKEPPVRFKQPLIDLEVWERDLAVLECEVPEDSVPITWYLEDRRLQPGDKYHMQQCGTKRRLTIRDIGVDDDGIYLCEMPDGGRSIAEVAVKGTIVRKLPRKVDVLEGENAAFCVEVEKEEMDIHWYKEGVELRETHQTILKSFGRTHILVFVNTMPQDSGLVMFYVGRSKTSSQLRVKAARHCPPSAPVGVQINTERANAALLSWIPAQDSRKNPPSGYVLERQEVGTGSQEWLQCLTTDSATSVEILGDSVPCEADYHFRICSVNKYGKSNNVEFPRSVHLVPVARIQAPLQDALVPEGQDALFSIELTASVIGTWFLNGTQVQEDERFSVRRTRTHQSLKIRGVRDTDNGAEITFVAYGIRDSAALYIQAPLVKFSPLSEMDRNKFVEAGNPIVLYCELSDPAAPVHWYKNGLELRAADGLHVQSEGTMRRIVIQAADFCHSGVYCCDAIDDVIRFNVEVEAPPVRFAPVPEAERSRRVQCGRALLLQCHVSDPAAQVQWLKDGSKLATPGGPELLSEGHARTLLVRSAQTSHAGLYSCKTKGDAVCFSVDVTAPVTLTAVGDTRRSCDAGEDVDLVCEVSDPKEPVTWFRDGAQVCDGGALEILCCGSRRHLRMVSATAEHSGVYSCCTASHALQFYVNVKAPPIRFSALPEAEQKKTVVQGHPLALQCKLSHPSGQVTWYKDGAKLLPESGVDIQSEGQRRSVFVPCAKRQHCGVYRCESKDDDIQFTVDIRDSAVKAAMFLELPDMDRKQQVPEGSPVVLQCELNQQPSDKVTWSKDGEKVHPDTNTAVHEEGLVHTLNICSAEARHSGVYACATNHDQVQFEVEVKGRGPHILPLALSDQNRLVRVGAPIVLQCRVSEAGAQVTWAKDHTELFCRTGLDMKRDGCLRKLMLHCAKPCDAGAYSCSLGHHTLTFHVHVQAPPVTFLPVLEEELLKSAVEQEELVLSCQVSAPDAAVRWYKDGAEVQPGDGVDVGADGSVRSLTVRSVQLSDSGTFCCRTGDSAMAFQVTVREPPVMIVHPKEDVHLDRHVPDEVILSCELSRANGVVSWFKDGQKLQESENIKLKVEGPYRRLKILSGLVEDSGEYVCDTDHDSIFFQLNITEPPVRIVSPSQRHMELCQQTCERVVLSCEISRPDAAVCWYRDGLRAEEGPNLLIEEDGVYRRLVIPETSTHDSAEYVCDTADDSMTFVVNIAEPPVRFVRPRKWAGRVEKAAGEAVVLECEVSRPDAEVTWTRDGDEVDDSVAVAEDGVLRRLTIHALTAHEAGRYVCDAKDDLMDFTVAVREPPVQIVGKPEGLTQKTFCVSDDIVLVCELSRANAAVTWCKDGCPLEAGERHCAEEQGVFRSLVVLSARPEDSGEYRCEAGDDRMLFHVSVKEPPVHIVGNSGSPERHLLLCGEDLVLECEVSRPDAPVRWLRNGEELRPDERVTLQSSHTFRKLVLMNLQSSDAGEFTCDANDDRMITVVEVQEPPVAFVNKPASPLTAAEGGAVTLTAELSRAPGRAVHWLKDGRPLDAPNVDISSYGGEQRLTLSPLQLCDAGEYVCDATSDQMSFSLLVQEMKVKFVRPLQSTVALRGHSLTLQCHVNKASGDVQWLKDGQEVALCRRLTIRAQGQERSLTVHEVCEDDAGEYSCASTHDSTMATVAVQTPRVVEFIAGLRSVTVQEGEDAVFKCVVSPEDVALAWQINGQPPPSDRAAATRNGTCHTLRLCRCGVRDSGTVNANAEGQESSAELQVQEPQVLFTRQMGAVTAEEAGEALLEVEVNLDAAEVQWMRQGVVLHAGPKYGISRRGRAHVLRVRGLAPSDGGVFSCETLHDRTQATLTITPRRISITKGLSDVRTTERDTASLEVHLSHPDVGGAWFRNGTPLKPSARFRMSCKRLVHSLTISNLSVDDTGSFTFCVDELKTTARLVVREPPVSIFRKLEDQKFPEGAVISIECELSRHNVDVRWSKNGGEVKPCKELRIYAMGRKRFLQVMKCQLSDSGVYTCDAGDASTSCSVEVYERELVVLQELEDVEIMEDQNAVFMCELSVEDIQGEWFKKGEKIQNTSSIKTRQEGTKHFLLMCNVRPEDSGEIKFVARHVESVALLDVEELPVSIVKPLQDQTAVERSRVLLDCTVSNPRCSCRWFRGRSVILPSERFEICSEGSRRKLLIQQVALEDEGTYSVQVGEHCCSAQLSVQGEPWRGDKTRSMALVRGLCDLQVVAPGEACFEVEVEAPLQGAAAWTLNGEPLHPGAGVLVEKMGTLHRLTFRRTTAHTSGDVEFTSGTTKSRARLTVLSAPASPAPSTQHSHGDAHEANSEAHSDET